MMHGPKFVRYVGVATLVITGAACAHGPEPDAYGAFEATEVTVSAESSGRLLAFLPEDGAHLAAGATVGVIDTAQIALQRDQTSATRSGAAARRVAADQQVRAIVAQLDIAKRAYERTQRLVAQQAATSQQLDQNEREYRVLGAQLAAVRAQREAADRDVQSSEARVGEIEDRLRKSTIVNPVGGTVLVAYMKRGEMVQPGQPLYKIADLDSMILRAYVAEPQVARVRIGAGARVSIDVGHDKRQELDGVVTWVSSQSEFTPTPIQTRDERANLVYAVKIRVANPNGIVKVGMPADVRFVAQTASR